MRLGFEVSRFPDFCEGGWHVPTYLGVWSLGLFSPIFFSTSSKKKRKKDTYLPDREASLIKKEYCRCGPHPLQVTSPRARPPLVKGAGCIGPLFSEFRGWPLWLMASIALRGLSTPAPEVVPGASLHSEALSPECGRECRGLEIVSQLDI